MEKEILDRILGNEKLIAIYGYWPSFHDSEIISIRMDRNSEINSQGPILRVKIHLFKMTSEVDEKGFYKNIDHAIVDLKLVSVEDCNLIGFNHQNVLNGLTIEETKENAKESRKLFVEFDSAYGLGGDLKCERVEIENIEFGIPEGSVYDKK